MPHARVQHLKVVDVKALIQRVVLGHREGVGVHALRHALLVAHRARGERLHGLVSVQVSAPDLAPPGTPHPQGLCKVWCNCIQGNATTGGRTVSKMCVAMLHTRFARIHQSTMLTTHGLTTAESMGFATLTTI
jgi:hypothetical protein